MKKRAGICRIFFFILVLIPFFSDATFSVGIGKSDITPYKAAPSAGYDRPYAKMQGVHDPLLALALFIDNGEKKVVFCSVDHLGFTYEMVQNIVQRVHCIEALSKCEIYIGSSHTHSGGGAYLNIPVIGDKLAGPYDHELTLFYETQTVKAIVEAAQQPVPAKIGIGYGKAEKISKYRASWPERIEPLSDVSIIKVIKNDGTPLAVLFNYPLHPTVLDKTNCLFSSDFVGYTRNQIQSLLGSDIQSIYFNGAQGDIIPLISNDIEGFEACEMIGTSLAKTVEKIWHMTDVKEGFDIQCKKECYSFVPQRTPQGVLLPLKNYETEVNVLIFDQKHAFITVPGELSCIYDWHFKEFGKKIGLTHVSIFGLTNDAHGYIISADSWRHKTLESNLSFGGEHYGESIKVKIENIFLNSKVDMK